MMCITRTSEVNGWPRGQEQVAHKENFLRFSKKSIYQTVNLLTCDARQGAAGASNGGGAGAAGGKEV